MRRLLGRISLVLSLLVSIGVLWAASPSLGATTPTLRGPGGVTANLPVQRASDTWISGTGLTPNTGYTLSAPYGMFGSSKPLSVTTDASGNFSWVDFSLGTDVPFSVTKFPISATDQSNTVVASIDVEVFPPQFGAGYCPGQSETVTGRGFPDGTYTIATSDPSGVALSASTVTPTHGVVTVQAIPANSPPMSVRVTLTSQADPTLTWSTIWQRAGSYRTGSTTDQTWWSMTAHASCFIPGEKVDVFTHDTATVVPTSVTADSHGEITFMIDFHPTAAPHVSNGVSVNGEQSGQTANIGAPVAVAGTQLHPGQVLEFPNHMIVSPRGPTRLARGYFFWLNGGGCDPMVVEENSDHATWDAGVPWQNTVCHMAISDSGNLAVSSSSGAVLWATHTRGTSTGNYVVMRQDGNVAIYSATGALIWISGEQFVIVATGQTWTTGGPQAPPAMARLASGATLRRSHYIRNGNTKFELTYNGNIVVLRGAQQVWSSGTAGRGGVALTMKRNGDLVLKNAAGRIVWSSLTANRGLRDQVVVGANGDVAIWSARNHRVWHTGTGI